MCAGVCACMQRMVHGISSVYYKNRKPSSESTHSEESVAKKNSNEGKVENKLKGLWLSGQIIFNGTNLCAQGNP